MSLAVILLQLISYCNAAYNNTYECRRFMEQCAVKNYNKQSVESTADYCIRDWIKSK